MPGLESLRVDFLDLLVCSCCVLCTSVGPRGCRSSAGIAPERAPLSTCILPLCLRCLPHLGGHVAEVVGTVGASLSVCMPAGDRALAYPRTDTHTVSSYPQNSTQLSCRRPLCPQTPHDHGWHMHATPGPPAHRYVAGLKIIIYIHILHPRSPR